MLVSGEVLNFLLDALEDCMDSDDDEKNEDDRKRFPILLETFGEFRCPGWHPPFNRDKSWEDYMNYCREWAENEE